MGLLVQGRSPYRFGMRINFGWACVALSNVVRLANLHKVTNELLASFVLRKNINFRKANKPLFCTIAYLLLLALVSSLKAQRINVRCILISGEPSLGSYIV